MSVISYLDCGCAILSDGGRVFCPSCASDDFSDEDDTIERARIEERKKICDLLWDLLDISESSPGDAIPVKLKAILEILSRGQLPKGV